MRAFPAGRLSKQKTNPPGKPRATKLHAGKAWKRTKNLTEQEGDDRLKPAATDVQRELSEGAAVTPKNIRRLLDVPQVLKSKCCASIVIVHKAVATFRMRTSTIHQHASVVVRAFCRGSQHITTHWSDGPQNQLTRKAGSNKTSCSKDKPLPETHESTAV